LVFLFRVNLTPSKTKTQIKIDNFRV